MSCVRKINDVSGLSETTNQRGRASRLLAGGTPCDGPLCVRSILPGSATVLRTFEASTAESGGQNAISYASLCAVFLPPVESGRSPRSSRNPNGSIFVTFIKRMHLYYPY